MKAFKFILKLININTTPRPGFFVLIDNQICQITKVNRVTNTVTIDDDKELPASEIEGKFVKFIGEYENQTYNIINSYFPAIVGFLYNEVDKTDSNKYTWFLDALLAGERIYLMGIFEEIKTRTLPNEAVKINSLPIVDRFKLYDVEDRVGIVKTFDNKTHLFTIKLKNDVEVVCRRDGFVKIGDKDIISMIKLQCPTCKQ